MTETFLQQIISKIFHWSGSPVQIPFWDEARTPDALARGVCQKQYGYSSMAEHDWRRWGILNNYFNTSGHPKQKRAEAAIEWGKKFDGYDPEKEKEELREELQKIVDKEKKQIKKEQL